MPPVSVISGHKRSSFDARTNLIINPAVSFLHALGERSRRRPIEHFRDQCVVAVTAPNAFRRVKLVGSLQFDTGNVFNKIDKQKMAEDMIAGFS